MTLVKGSPTHDAEWKPMRYFVDKDGTVNVTFLKYVKNQRLCHRFGIKKTTVD